MIESMHPFTLLFLVTLFIGTALQLWLAARQVSSVKRHRASVPDEFTGKISLQEHQKAADYTSTKVKFGHFDGLIGVAVLLAWTLGGGLALLDTLWSDAGLSPVLTGIVVILSMFFISSLIDLPFSLYSTFVIEERFGFNKTTIGQFVKDLITQGGIGLLIGAAVIWGFLTVMESFGEYWWFAAWLFWTAFMLTMTWAYPTLIAPLFNEFKPLDDETLRNRIQRLMDRCGFQSNGIFVMDGSKRSGHGNAYFTGMGKSKRIVFFDTLLDQLNGDEIEAVLAHELGHFKRKHITKRMITMIGLSLAGMALLGWLTEQAWFYSALGITTPSNYMALVLFMLVLPVFSTFFAPISSAMSRKHEFEADDYAAQQTNAADLIRALVKLYRENANTLTPDSLYSAFHDSHPPAPVRIANLSNHL